MILENYLINPETMIISRGRSIDFGTRIIEINQELRVKPEPLAVIDRACMHHHYTTYKQIRQSIRKLHNFIKKVPLPLIFNCFIPTHRIDHIDCCWISHLHIRDHQGINQGRKTIIQFHTGFELTLNVSYSIIKRQIERANKLCLRSFQQIHNIQRITHILEQPIFPY